MHRCIQRWLASALTVSVAWGTATVASAQYGPMLPADPGYVMSDATDSYFANMAEEKKGNEKDLAARVKELESALKKIKDKETADKKKASSAPTVKVRGRIHFDTNTFSQNAASASSAQGGDAFNSVYFRRARIGVSGDAFDVVDYKIEMDFAGQTSFKDVYVTIKELPYIQNIRFGHFYEAWGLETQTSSNYITFMERSLINEIGNIGGRKLGAMAFGWSENQYFTWAVSGTTAINGETPPNYPYDWRTGLDDPYTSIEGYSKGRYGLYDDEGGYACSMRATYLPWYDECSEGRGLLHTGMSYTYRDVPELVEGQTQRYRVRQKPEAYRGTYVVDTGYLDDAETINALQPEAAFVYGPFSVQTEYMWMMLNRGTHANAMFDGGYIYFSYFLTGEHRRYEKERGLFARVKPYENFFRVRTEDGCVETGLGAWEVGYRCSYMNLTDAGVHGGRVVDHTIGVNWYLNAYTRLMADYVHSTTTDRRTSTGQSDLPAGVENTFMTRVQIDF